MFIQFNEFFNTLDSFQFALEYTCTYIVLFARSKLSKVRTLDAFSAFLKDTLVYLFYRGMLENAKYRRRFRPIFFPLHIFFR